MKRDKYAAELQQINKLEQKINIKQVNNMDTEKDESGKDAAILELFAKSMEDDRDSKSNITSAAKTEVKRIIKTAQKQIPDFDKSTKEYCFVILDAVDKWIDECEKILKTEQIDAMFFACDVLQELIGNEAYGIFVRFCDGANSHDIDCNLYELYPEFHKTYQDLSRDECIHTLNDVFAKLKILIRDMKEQLKKGDLWYLLQLTSFLTCSSLAIIDLMFCLKE